MKFYRLSLRRRHIAIAASAALAVMVILIAFVHPAAAETKAADNVVAAAGNALGNAIFLILSTIVWAMTKLFATLTYVFVSILVVVSRYNTFLNAPVVKSGWPIVRDLMNMLFIIALIIIAAGTVLRLQNYRYNRLLGKLIIMAFLVNFSKFIAVFLLQFAQVVMLTFVNAYKDAAFGNFSSMFGLDSIFAFSAGQNIFNNNGNFSVFISMVAGLAMMMIAFVVTLAITVMLFVRIIALWLLIILSPIAYALRILPNTERYASQWWSEFTKYAVLGPVLAFFLWLALAVVATGSCGDLTGCNNPLAADPAVRQDLHTVDQDSAGLRSDLITNILGLDKLVSFVVSIIFLMLGLQYAQKSGAAGASFAGKVAQKGFGAAAFVTGASPLLNAVRDRTIAPVQGWIKNRQDNRRAAVQDRTNTLEAAGDRLKANYGFTQGARERGQANVNAYERNKTARVAQKQGYKDLKDDDLHEKMFFDKDQRVRLAAMQELQSRGKVNLEDGKQNDAFEDITRNNRVPLADRLKLREQILDSNIKSMDEGSLRASAADLRPENKDRRTKAAQELDRRQLLKADDAQDQAIAQQLGDDVKDNPEKYRQYRESMMKANPDMAMKVLFKDLAGPRDMEAYKTAIQQRQIGTSSMGKKLYESLDDDKRKDLMNHLVAISPDAETLRSHWKNIDPEAAQMWSRHLDMASETNTDRRAMVAKETGAWGRAFMNPDGTQMRKMKADGTVETTDKGEEVFMSQEYFDKIGGGEIAKNISNDALENADVQELMRRSSNFRFKDYESLRSRSKETRDALTFGLENAVRQMQGKTADEAIDPITLGGDEEGTEVGKRKAAFAQHLFLASKGKINPYDIEDKETQAVFERTLYGASATDVSSLDDWIKDQAPDSRYAEYVHEAMGINMNLGELHDLYNQNPKLAKTAIEAATAELKRRVAEGGSGAVQAKNRLRRMAADSQISQFVDWSPYDDEEDGGGKKKKKDEDKGPDAGPSEGGGSSDTGPKGPEPTRPGPTGRPKPGRTKKRPTPAPAPAPTPAPAPEPTPAPEPPEPEERAETLRDIDRTKFERTQAMAKQYENAGGLEAFYLSSDYLDDKNGYLSPAVYAQAEKNAGRSVQPLGGISTFGRRNTLSYDSRQPEFAAFQNAGEYITGAQRKKEFAAAYVPMIDAEIAALKKNDTLSAGETERLKKLESTKAALSDPKALENLQIINRGRLGYSDRHAIAHERTHAKLDEIDADHSLRAGLMDDMEPKVLNDVLAAVRTKMGDENLTDEQAFDEYLTEGIVNSKQSWADVSPDAIAINPDHLAKIQDRARSLATDEQKSAGQDNTFAVSPEVGTLGKFKADSGAAKAMWLAFQAKTDRAGARVARQAEEEAAKKAAAASTDEAAEAEAAALAGAVSSGESAAPTKGSIGSRISSAISSARQNIDQQVVKAQLADITKKQKAVDDFKPAVAEKLAAVRQATTVAEAARQEEKTAQAAAVARDRAIETQVGNLKRNRDIASGAGDITGVQKTSAQIETLENERRALRQNAAATTKKRKDAEVLESRAKIEAREVVDLAKEKDEALQRAKAKADEGAIARARTVAETQQAQKAAQSEVETRRAEVAAAKEKEIQLGSTQGREAQAMANRINEINAQLSKPDPRRSAFEERGLRNEQSRLQQKMKVFDAQFSGLTSETNAAQARLQAAEQAASAAEKAVTAAVQDQKTYTRPKPATKSDEPPAPPTAPTTPAKPSAPAPAAPKAPTADAPAPRATTSRPASTPVNPTPVREAAPARSAEPSADISDALSRLTGARSEELSSLRKAFEDGVKSLERTGHASAEAMRKQFDRLPHSEGSTSIDPTETKRLFKEFGEELLRTVRKPGTTTGGKTATGATPTVAKSTKKPISS